MTVFQAGIRFTVTIFKIAGPLSLSGTVYIFDVYQPRNSKARIYCKIVKKVMKMTELKLSGVYGFF